MKTLDLTKTQRKALPALHSTEGVRLEHKIAVAKFFMPGTSWTWYVIEYDGFDTCWGLVEGICDEYGYFSLEELQSLVSPAGLTVERDVHFMPITIRELDIPFTF